MVSGFNRACARVYYRVGCVFRIRIVVLLYWKHLILLLPCFRCCLDSSIPFISRSSFFPSLLSSSISALVTWLYLLPSFYGVRNINVVSSRFSSTSVFVYSYISSIRISSYSVNLQLFLQKVNHAFKILHYRFEKPFYRIN